MSNRRYGLEETEFEKLDIRLLYITQARYDTDWHSIAHTHHFTELFYVIHGSGFFLVEGKKFPVKEDDLVIVNPNVSHTELSDKNKPLEYIALGINGLKFKDGNLNSIYDYSLHNFREHKEEFSFYLKTLLREIQNKGEYFETICQNLLEALILTLVRRTKKKLAIAPTKKITKECRFVEQYIDEHFTEDITLQTLSDLTYLNKYYLVHSFKEYKGTSPINYLITKRIQEAKHLLETTNHSVAKIANMIGFSSQSYFSQVFKRETNMTPNECRKLIEKKDSTSS
ncbi:AraC family transcriptional regulator [Faecalimonas sp. LCP19S3_D12]